MKELFPNESQRRQQRWGNTAHITKTVWSSHPAPGGGELPPSCDQQAVPGAQERDWPEPRALYPLCHRVSKGKTSGPSWPATCLRCPPEPTGPPQPVHAAGNPVFFTRAWKGWTLQDPLPRKCGNSSTGELQSLLGRRRPGENEEPLCPVGRSFSMPTRCQFCVKPVYRLNGLSK